QDMALNEEPFWLAGLIRSAAPMLFTELCGFVLFRALGSEYYTLAPHLLRKSDLQSVFEKLEFAGIERVTRSDAPTPTRVELFSQMWCLFNDIVERLAEDQAWKNSFFTQSSRPRFMYSAETRKRLLKNVETMDKTCATRGLKEPWSEHF